MWLNNTDCLSLSQRRLRITTQITVDTALLAKWPVFLQNALAIVRMGQIKNLSPCVFAAQNTWSLAIEARGW